MLYAFQRVVIMVDYKLLYSILFNAMTDALDEMEQQNYGRAREDLIAAQQKVEDIYIHSEY